MPMLTTFRIGLPVKPVQAPERTASAKAAIRSSTSCTSATTSTPSTTSERSPRHPQRDVEDGAVLGDVDPLAREHRVAPLGDACLLGERDEQPQRLVGDAVLRVVEEEAGRLDGEPLGTAGIGCEELAQMRLPQLRRVGRQGSPGGRFLHDR